MNSASIDDKSIDLIKSYKAQCIRRFEYIGPFRFLYKFSKLGGKQIVHFL